MTKDEKEPQIGIVIDPVVNCPLCGNRCSPVSTPFGTAWGCFNEDCDVFCGGREAVIDGLFRTDPRGGGYGPH